MSFLDLGINDAMVGTCTAMGLRNPTKIQELCIPKVLAGLDVVGRAKTGSGKTAAFALPIIEKLSRDPFGVFAIILTPTRELAYQIAEQFRALGAPVGLRDAVVVGGMDMLTQNTELADHPHIIIATPGRLADLLKQGATPNLDYLEFVVFDEADRLLEDCFQPDINTILDKCPDKEDRQTLLFSATLTKELAHHEQSWTRMDPLPTFCEVDLADDQAETKHLVETLDQQYLFIPQKVKECYLLHLLSALILKSDDSDDEDRRAGSSSPNGASSVIVFASTCRGAEVLAAFLEEMKVECESLHSRKNQARRLAALGKFRGGSCKILIATDVASRGLDIPSVQYVINYDVPRQCEDYVHRVGRTARAGRGGMAITLVSEYDINIFKQIEEFINLQMKQFETKEEKVLELLKSVTQAKKMAKIRLDDYEAQQTSRNKFKKRRRNRMDHNEDGNKQEEKFIAVKKQKRKSKKEKKKTKKK